MSNSILPPLLSDSPPPVVADDEEFEDEFGDFKGPEELSFDNENPPTPSSLKNSNDYIPDSYPDINLCNIEERYRIIENNENKSTATIRTDPPSNYFSLWEQIENNIPEIIDNEEDLETVKEKVENDDETNNHTTCQSKEDLDSSISHKNGKHLDHESSKSAVNCVDSTENNLGDFDELKQQKNDDCAAINSLSLNHSKNIENCKNDSISTEISSVQVSHSTNENTIIPQLHASESISNHSTEEKYSSEDLHNINDDDINELSSAEEPCSKKLDIHEELKTSSYESVKIEDNHETDDDFGEFADFSSSNINNIPTPENNVNSVNNEVADDFNEFGSYQINCIASNNADSLKSNENTKEETESKQKEIIVVTEVEDDFDEFGSYQINCISDNHAETSKSNENTIEEMKSKQNRNTLNNVVEDDFDDFGSYRISCIDTNKNESTQNKSTVNNVVDDDFDEFGSFQISSFAVKGVDSSKSNGNTKEETESKQNENNEVEDDFDEFGSFQVSSFAANDVNTSKSNDNTQKETESIKKETTEEVDEFDDFASYSEQSQKNTTENYDCDSNTSDKVFKICKTSQEAFKETQSVLEKMFPICDYTSPEYSNTDFVTNNSIFEDLKDITETHALTYQWGKSAAQKNILKTLNIDIRNILYGPTWNSGMPIFAPNLCSKPLEPIKSELPIPISPQKVVETQEPKEETTMPQFDWTGSGLTDLQDSSLNTDQEFHSNIQTPIEEFEVIQPTYVESSSIPPKLNHPEKDPSVSRKVEGVDELRQRQEIIDDFSDFTSYQQSTEKETKWDNMLPLRESHISNNERQDNTDTDKISIYFQELTMGKSQAVAIDQFKTNPKITNNVNSLDPFEKEQTLSEPPFVFDDSQKIKPKAKLEQLVPNDLVENSLYLQTQASNHCDISLDNFSTFKTADQSQIDEKSIGTKQQEDEFSDFQSSLPCPAVPSIQPTLLEPLKPAILQPEPVKDKSLKIEWPEPGIDEVEINRIVNGVLRKNSTNENVAEKTDNKEPVKSSPSKSVQSNDNDDWSDFISVKEPLKSRTSTPDLPLSVFNLGSIQPNKVSAPFVDPNGVVHSPSKTPNTIKFPLANRNVQNGAQQNYHRQPFITSNAFDALYSNSKNSIIQPGSSRKPVDSQQSVPQYSYDKMSTNSFSQSGRYQNQHESSGANSKVEEDDWGDFVSAPNTISNSSSNFFQPLSYMKTNFGFSGKTAPAQKLTTVPKNTVVKQERNSFPVISTMPDLDFVSPKSRSTIK